MKKDCMIIDRSGKQVYMEPTMKLHKFQTDQTFLSGSEETLPIDEEWPSEYPAPW